MNTSAIQLPTREGVDLLSPIREFFASFWGCDLGMDLGTANTLIYMKDRGIVLNEPSVVAINERTGGDIAIGRSAKEMYGKTSHMTCCSRPMKDGVIADFDMTAMMITSMIQSVKSRWSLKRPRIVIGVPSGITSVEKRAVIDAALAAGTSEVLLVEESMAAALGAGLPVDKPVGNMIVDIGGGTTEVAIISMNGTFYSHSIRVAGDEMDEAIQRYIKREFRLDIGIFEAERVKLLIGSALPSGRERSAIVSGRDISSGMPSQLEIGDDAIREALQEPIAAIVSSVTTALEQVSPELANDIIARGIVLAGGGALLKGLDERLSRETNILFQRAHDPLSCVARGVGAIVDDMKNRRMLCSA